MGSQAVILSNERFGVKPAKTVGIKVPELRKIAKEIGINHPLSMNLWETGLREARIIATLIADPEHTNLKLMKKWADSSDSWDVVDSCCNNLFWKTKKVDEMIKVSINAKTEMSKRFSFVLMAYRAKKDHSVEDEKFKEYLDMIFFEKSDKRHYVTKAIEWAIRAISGRNRNLNRIVSDHLNASKDSTSKEYADPNHLITHGQGKRRSIDSSTKDRLAKKSMANKKVGGDVI